MAALPEVRRVKLGSQGFEVSKQGLGCMGMSAMYGPPKPEQEMIDLIHHAVELGVTFFDTSDAYGPHTNEILIGKAIKGIRDRVQIATKFGLLFDPANPQLRGVKGTPEYVRACCESSLKRLDIDCIDLFYQHRVDPAVPIEVTIGEMKKLVEEGKVKYLGLSEASSSDIRRAHAVHPITAYQIEWSLWCREVEDDVIPTCRELGIGIVPYSPLGRGFFSGLKVETLADTDVRKAFLPRFQEGTHEKNLVFFNRLVEIGTRRSKTPGQIALAWVHSRGDEVVPIPGTTRIKNLEENIGALDITFSKEELDETEAAVPNEDIAGSRYPEMVLTATWQHVTSPPLSTWATK